MELPSVFQAIAITTLISAILVPASAVCADPQATVSVSQRIISVLQPFVDRHALAGAVTLVADKNGIVNLQAVGWADIAAKKPIKTDSIFWIASQSKPITATALMMLVDEGRVHLDDPVEKYLPEFRGQWLSVEHDDSHQLLKRPSHPITVREILSHTSGLPFSSSIENPTLDQRPLSERVVSYAVSPLQFEPGSKYSYANAGINTAGRIIEVVSGMPYEKYLDTKLFEPLGMKDTSFWPNPQQIQRLARSYRPNEKKDNLEETTVTQLRYPLNDRKNRYPMPAGGLFSTATDLSRFCRMVLNGGTLDGRRYLSEAAVKEMTSKQTGSLPDGYGLGWSTGGGSFGHGGAYATNMNIDSNSGEITIWMVQHAGYPLDGDKAYGAFRDEAKKEFAQK